MYVYKDNQFVWCGGTFEPLNTYIVILTKSDTYVAFNSVFCCFTK